MKKKSSTSKEPKYVTLPVFERAMRDIAKSFETINKTLAMHEEVLQSILKEIKAIHEDHKDFRSSIANIYSENLSRDRRIENLTARVEKLELKTR